MDILEMYPTKIFPEPNTGCWLCIIDNNQHGYARVIVDGRKIGAHRLSYETSVGAIPTGHEIDHLCRVTCCVNPDHLEPVPQYENKRRAGQARQQENGFRCRNGHPISHSNSYFYPSGKRRCRSCARDARLRYRMKGVAS